MKDLWKKITLLVEVFSNFFFAIIVCFMAILPISFLFRELKGRKGILWVLLTIVVVVLLYVAVSLWLNKALGILDRIRKGNLLSWFFKPIRNISAVLGIYGVFKVEYFLIHNDNVPSSNSWLDFIWQFFTNL